MRLFIVLATIGAILSGICWAEDGAIPEDVLEKLAKDLAELDRETLGTWDQAFAAHAHAALGHVSQVKVTADKASIRVGAAEDAGLLLRSDRGETYTVIDTMENWYAVRLDEPVRGFSAGWISIADVVPDLAETGGRGLGAMAASSMPEWMYRIIVERAAKLRDEYSDNPYISMSGFAVEIGIPPSLSVNFEFKD